MSDSKSKIWASVKLFAPVLLFALSSTLLVVALTPVLSQIQYSKLALTISALNAPDKVKQILLFLLNYNVYLLLCGFFGAAVGASEIMTRNRDEPFRAVKSPPGLRYLLVNAGISMAAFYLLHHFKDSIMPGVINDPLLASVGAGFGAMVIMRAKILNFKDDKGISTAPDSVISNFLASINLQIGRYRASQRQQTVYEESQKIQDPATAPEFLRTFLISYEYLTNEERALLDAEITRIYEGTEFNSPRLKFMCVAFGLLNVMGETNFRTLMQQLSNYQQLSRDAAQTQLVTPLGQVEPEPVPPPVPLLTRIDASGVIIPASAPPPIPPAAGQINPSGPLTVPPTQPTLTLPHDETPRDPNEDESDSQHGNGVD